MDKSPYVGDPYSPTMKGTAPFDYIQDLAGHAGMLLTERVPQGWLPVVLIYRIDPNTQDPEGKQNVATFPLPSDEPATAFILHAVRAAAGLLDPEGVEHHVHLLTEALQSIVLVERHKRECGLCDPTKQHPDRRLPCMSMAGLLLASQRKREKVGMG